MRPQGWVSEGSEIPPVMTFKVLIDGKVPSELDVESMYLASLEGQPIRARFQYIPETGLLFCERRSQGLAALNVAWPVRGGGRIMMRTAFLQDRGENAYVLPLELARGQLAEVWRKREDWGYAYGTPTEAIDKEFREVKRMLARAQTVQESPLTAAALAEEAIARIILLGEDLALADAARGLAGRRRRGELAQVDFGCHWSRADVHPKAQERFGGVFNYATVPFTWREIEPREHEYDWKWHDDWIQWLEAKGMAIKGGSLVRFTDKHLPDWVWIWENDFETIRDSVFDHIERCVQRYRGRVDHWDAVTGLHVENCMNFALDRIIEVTRVCCHAVKRTDPVAKVVLDVVYPWGEYYGTNQRSIWPYHYAEMCINAGVQFDAVGLQVYMGTAGQGYACRDMLALSDILDRFGNLGRPVHVTAVGAPSAVIPDPDAALSGNLHRAGAGGVWHRTWDETMQADWIEDFYRIAIAKPFIEAISWRDFTDQPAHYFPHGGLLRRDLQPKMSYQRLAGMRREIWPEAVAGAGDSKILWPA